MQNKEPKLSIRAVDRALNLKLIEEKNGKYLVGYAENTNEGWIFTTEGRLSEKELSEVVKLLRYLNSLALPIAAQSEEPF